jgi:hypothetical protein
MVLCGHSSMVVLELGSYNKGNYIRKPHGLHQWFIQPSIRSSFCYYLIGVCESVVVPYRPAKQDSGKAVKLVYPKSLWSIIRQIAILLGLPCPSKSH